MKNKKWSWQRIIGIILIVIGLVLIAVNFLPNPMIGHNVNKSNQAVESITSDEIKANKDSDEATFDFSAVENISTTGTYTNPLDLDQSLILGQLVVPQIDMNLTVFKGVDNQILNAGVGTMRADQEMGKGNYAIAGHYDWNDDLFHRLTWIKAGDVIRLTDKEKIYEYVAVDNTVVEPSEIQLISDEYADENYGSPIISLMNCFYPQRFNNGNDDRYFVFGMLVNETDYSEDKMNQKSFNWDNDKEKQAFEKNNPVNNDKYQFEELKENQWQEREEVMGENA